MARTKEQKSWDNFKTCVDTNNLKFLRVENIAGVGMPDVIGQNRHGTMFFIENKAIEAFPARAATPVVPRAFEPGQLPFIRSWNQWGGYAFVLLRVGLMHYLLRPVDVSDDIESMNKSGIEEFSIEKDKKNIIEYLEGLK